MAANGIDGDLAERKRELIARSDLYRQAIVADLGAIRTSLSWVNRAGHLARTAAPYAAMGLPVLGWLLTRRGRPPQPQAPTQPQKKSLFALVGRAWHAFQIFQQVWPVFQNFRQMRTRG